MWTRRGFLAGTAAGIVACGTRTRSRPNVPQITHGVQAGVLDAARAIIWARCSEPARMIVEWDTTTTFANARRVAGDVVTPERDLCGTVEISNLPIGQTILYRVRFDREAERGTSAWAEGRLHTPRDTTFRVAWTGDTCGQGYGRNPEWGGLRGFAAVAKAQPELFINSGDLIYGDNPIEATKTTPDGRTWKNVTNERVARVAQELDDFRARFAYNFEDDHVRALAASCGSIVQWDDHETHNNWWPGQQLADDRYTKERDASKLAAMARRAMFEWSPLAQGPFHRVVSYGPLLDVFVLDCRSFRTPNDTGANTAMLGAEQAKWLVDAMAASKARWKIVANDQPVGVLIGDDGNAIEGWANGAADAPVGREIELAAILAGLKQRDVKNVVWITADVHYAAVHHFDPARAKLDFDPFYEFIAGPIHAGTFGPEVLDTTFGAEVKWQWHPPPGTGNLPPWDGIQSFGTIDVSKNGLHVWIWGIDGKRRHSVDIPFVGS